MCITTSINEHSVGFVYDFNTTDLPPSLNECCVFPDMAASAVIDWCVIGIELAETIFIERYCPL